MIRWALLLLVVLAGCTAPQPEPQLDAITVSLQAQPQTDRSVVFTITLCNDRPEPLVYYYLNPAFDLSSLEIKAANGVWQAVRPFVLLEGSRNLPELPPRSVVSTRVESKDFNDPHAHFKPGQYQARYTYSLPECGVISGSSSFEVE